MVVFLLVTVLAALLAHALLRRYLLATAIAALAVGAAGLAYASAGRTAQLGPDDLILWGPLLVITTTCIALPLTALLGLPFLAVRVGTALRVEHDNNPTAHPTPWWRVLSRFI